MTGIECLKDELKKRGFNRLQCENKLVYAMLDIFANGDGQWMDLHNAEQQRDEAILKAKRAWQEAERASRETEAFREELTKLKNIITQKLDAFNENVKEYVERFYSAINDCETPEGRDALRAAQMFVNSVNVDTKYDNTAFIIGLSAILTMGKIAPIEELRKINKKAVPDLHLYYHGSLAYPFIKDVNEK